MADHAHVMLRQSCIEYGIMKEESDVDFPPSKECMSEFVACPILVN